MFSWSRPLRTSISPQTAASFPLTFFLGIILSATSLITPEFSLFLEPLEVADKFEFLRTPGEGIDVEDDEVGVLTAFGSDGLPGNVLTILAGTCHFAAYPAQQKGDGVQFLRGGDQTCIATHHNLAERSGAKHIKNLVLLLLREAMGLRKERIRQVRNPGHG